MLFKNILFQTIKSEMKLSLEAPEQRLQLRVTFGTCSILVFTMAVSLVPTPKVKDCKECCAMYFLFYFLISPVHSATQNIAEVANKKIKTLTQI